MSSNGGGTHGRVGTCVATKSLKNPLLYGVPIHFYERGFAAESFTADIALLGSPYFDEVDSEGLSGPRNCMSGLPVYKRGGWRSSMPYDFLIDTYETECIKVISVWSEFATRTSGAPARATSGPQRARADGAPVRERKSVVPRHAGHRCRRAAVAAQEIRLAFIKRYAEDSGKRFEALREKRDPWWEEETAFFDVRRSRAWVMTRRLTHTSHHRGQLMAMLRMLGHDLHSNYGPTADTGGLMQNHAPTIYAYANLDALLTVKRRRRETAFPWGVW